jgi:hypothetical protein
LNLQPKDSVDVIVGRDPALRINLKKLVACLPHTSRRQPNSQANSSTPVDRHDASIALIQSAKLCPLRHQQPALFEQITTAVGCLYLVVYYMRQRHLDNFAGVIRSLGSRCSLVLVQPYFSSKEASDIVR